MNTIEQILLRFAGICLMFACFAVLTYCIGKIETRWLRILFAFVSFGTIGTAFIWAIAQVKK